MKNPDSEFCSIKKTRLWFAQGEEKCPPAEFNFLADCRFVAGHSKNSKMLIYSICDLPMFPSMLILTGFFRARLVRGSMLRKVLLKGELLDLQ